MRLGSEITPARAWLDVCDLKPEPAKNRGGEPAQDFEIAGAVNRWTGRFTAKANDWQIMTHHTTLYETKVM